MRQVLKAVQHVKPHVDVFRDGIPTAHSEDEVRGVVGEIGAGIIEIIDGIERFKIDESLHEPRGNREALSKRSKIRHVRLRQMTQNVRAGQRFFPRIGNETVGVIAGLESQLGAPPILSRDLTSNGDQCKVRCNLVRLRRRLLAAECMIIGEIGIHTIAEIQDGSEVNLGFPDLSMERRAQPQQESERET